jgi:hypothetical protein
MLVEFLQNRIQALTDENRRLENRETVLTTYIYELLDRDIPEAYKEVIRGDVFEK